jgi:hypothetical protein
MAEVDVLGLNRPFLLQQAAKARATGAGQREQQPNQHRRMHLEMPVPLLAPLNAAFRVVDG